MAAADNAFGFRLLNEVQKTVPGGNVILSPVSAALDLSMVLDGAGGQTRRQMQSALSLVGPELTAINEANAGLIQIIRTPTPSVTLSVANSLWVDARRVTLRADYVTRTQAWSGADLTDLDFSDPGALARINKWASTATHGRIIKSIDRIEPADCLLLLNAVYFKGQWMHKFNPAQTQRRAFTLAGGAVKQVARMAQSGRFDYFETPQLQAIRLAFGDGNLLMHVLLPATSSSLDALEAQLTAEHWTGWRGKYSPRAGTIELPRFELKANYRLNGPLQALGMTRVFQPDAQLTDMFSSAPGRPGTTRFFISSVRQSTYWKVDEEGSEAAAVTSIGVTTAALARPVPAFRMIVDRPFFCAIEDRRSGALLFVGAIHDPSI